MRTVKLKYALVPGCQGKPNAVLSYDGQYLVLGTLEGDNPGRYESRVLVFNVWDLLKAMFRTKFLGTKF